MPACLHLNIVWSIYKQDIFTESSVLKMAVKNKTNCIY